MPFIKVWVPGDSDDMPPGYHESPPRPPEPEVIVEVRTGMTVGEYSRERRIYPRSVLEGLIKEVKDAAEAGKPRIGELDPPDHAIVSMSRASHQLLDMRIDEETQELIGKIRLLPTPLGAIAKAVIMEPGAHARLCIRAWRQPDGNPEGLKLITFDLVYDVKEEEICGTAQ